MKLTYYNLLILADYLKVNKPDPILTWIMRENPSITLDEDGNIETINGHQVIKPDATHTGFRFS